MKLYIPQAFFRGLTEARDSWCVRWREESAGASLSCSFSSSMTRTTAYRLHLFLNSANTPPPSVKSNSIGTCKKNQKSHA